MSERVVCPKHLREALAWMRDELDLERLEVTLVPAPDQRHCGHMVRAVVGQNPEWYRDLLSMFPRSRRRGRDARYTDSTLNRKDVKSVIERLLTIGTRSQIATHLVDFAEAIHTQFHEEAA